MSDEKTDPIPQLHLVKKGRSRGRQVSIKFALPEDMLEDIRAAASAKQISIAQEIRLRLVLQAALDPKDMTLGKALRIILDYVRGDHQ